MAKVPEIFGSMVFNDQKMQERLPKSTYKALKKTIQNGEPLDLSVANVVAAAMKDWAVEMGCTHYTHWFQPLTEGTAEKHDASWSTTAKAAWWRNFRASSSSSRNPTPRRSPTAASAPPSKRAAILPGTRPRPYSCWATP